MEGSTKDRKWKCQQSPYPGGGFAFSYSLFIIKKVWDKKVVFREKRSDSTSVTCGFTIMLAQFSSSLGEMDFVTASSRCSMPPLHLKGVRAVTGGGILSLAQCFPGDVSSALGGGGVQGAWHRHPSIAVFLNTLY